eukprot:Platyproteum_vivax@DN5943_c0_g1_i1.p1
MKSSLEKKLDTPLDALIDSPPPRPNGYRQQQNFFRGGRRNNNGPKRRHDPQDYALLHTTWEIDSDTQETSIMLHNNKILQFMSSGDMMLSSCGHRTQQTLCILHLALKAIGMTILGDFVGSQNKCQIKAGMSLWDFTDEMVIRPQPVFQWRGSIVVQVLSQLQKEAERRNSDGPLNNFYRPTFPQAPPANYNSYGPVRTQRIIENTGPYRNPRPIMRGGRHRPIQQPSNAAPVTAPKAANSREEA